ncbi:unnamed protein product [Adineta ricciae]|uniref:Uncharacterized protein n=1 Tax=Adineta ricciae TaxID=249248 RepID=A0A814WDY5_ADIRI|nr:unnamed protein product [Adineta ricciae]CAF1201144.1 unnamed protein product [Adineta ricciae]
MFCQILIFFLLTVLYTTSIVSAVQCHNSDCFINLNRTIDIINTTHCTYSAADVCTTSLEIELLPSEGILTTTVWFRKKSITQKFIYLCTTDAFCGKDRAQELFHQAKALNGDSILNNLTESLHQTSANNNPKCKNEQNEEVTCNSGICQAIIYSGNDVVTRACVSPRETHRCHNTITPGIQA